MKQAYFPQEIEKRWQKEWEERDILIIKLLLYTGLRCSALYKLNISNINFVKRKLVAVDKGGKIPEFNLNDEIMEYINNWIVKRELLLGSDREEEALFISNQRRRMDQTSIYRVVNKYSKTITDKHITPHKLRATCGTYLLENSNDIYFVQEYLGHASPKTTELYIRGRKEENRKRAADIMSKIIK